MFKIKTSITGNKKLKTATKCQYSVNNKNILTYHNSFNLYINHTFNDWINYDDNENQASLTAKKIVKKLGKNNIF